MFLGTIVMWVLFIPWDIWFTQQGIWGFNEKFILGEFIANLPVEEWLFFLFVPFSCVFIYEVLIYFTPSNPLIRIQNKVTSAIIMLSFTLSIIFVDRTYTFFTFSLLSLMLLWHLIVKKTQWIGRFYLAYLLIQIPFLLVNGALTGLFTSEPVVWYNNAEMMGPRLITIPLEDLGYNMLMILIVITVHEEYKKRRMIKSELVP